MGNILDKIREEEELKKIVGPPNQTFAVREQKDNVNSPDHYTKGGIECIAAIEAALTPEEFRGYLKGNVLKYNWRCNHKNGIEDLLKAQWYLNKLIAKHDPAK